MQAHDFFLILLIVLLTARVFAELTVRLKGPSVIGELLAGVVLGPSLLGWIEPIEAIQLMAEIGIILLLFEVGLGTDLNQLAQSGRKSFVVALAGFALPLFFGVQHRVLDIQPPISRIAIYRRHAHSNQHWNHRPCTH